MAKRTKAKNDMMDRESFQNQENYPKIETDLPKDRFQNEVQTSVAKQTVTKGNDFIGNGNGTGSDSIVARTATAVKKKMAIKPSSGTELEDSKIVGGVPLGDSAATMSVAGALPTGISVDQSRVPYSKGGDRPSERYGKKISTDNFIINNVVSEQIKTEFDEPKDLREAPNATQGYNGRKQFNTARGKKVYGDHPAATLYERSIDFEEHGAAIHATGQVLSSIDRRSNYPIAKELFKVTLKQVTVGDDVIPADTIISDFQASKLKEDEDYVVTTDPNFVNADKGNYLIDSMTIKIKDGNITDLAFNEVKINSTNAAEAVDQANMNWQTDANNVAKAIIKLQTELGRETTDKWSPLGYVVDQPYEFGMLYHDGEAVLGSLTGAAYKSAAHSLAFLQNKMAKEGVRGVSSIAEWLGEDIAKASNGTYYDGITPKTIFNSDSLRSGSAAAIIKMFDSENKYTQKADFINQPRSFKMHLQTVDNNINPFHAKKEFFKALDQTFVFSTEDGNYNPVLPVHITNEVKVMLPYSLNAWLKGWKNPHVTGSYSNTLGHGAFFRETGITHGCNYKYKDIRNEYSWEYVDPFVAGLCRYLLRHEAALAKAYDAMSGEAVITLPIHFTNTTGNMFNFLVCSASQDMAWMRNLIFRDYLFAGEQGVYVWDDLLSMSDVNPLFSSQYQYSDYGSALKLGALSSVNKVRFNWPELISLREAYYADDTGSGAANEARPSYYLPFYFNEEGIDPEATSGISPDKGAVMSYPIIRAGVNHEFVDVLYSMTERDVRLCLDRMVTTPVTTEYDEEDGIVTSSHNGDKYHYSSLRYDNNSDGRVVMTLKPDEDANTYALHDWTYLATPRELGFLFPLPVNIAKSCRDLNGNIVEADINEYVTGSLPASIIAYRATGAVSNGTIIDRSASLSQTWNRLFADSRLKESNNEFVKITGLVPCISCIFDTVLDEKGDSVLSDYRLINNELTVVPAIYKLRSSELERVDNIDNSNPTFTGNNTIFSMARLIWTMIQRRYAPINVFENAFLNINDGGATVPTLDGLATDPLEFATYFGFAGTLASDFNQDILERLSKKDELGMYYFEDEFIKSSLIFN